MAIADKRSSIRPETNECSDWEAWKSSTVPRMVTSSLMTHMHAGCLKFAAAHFSRCWTCWRQLLRRRSQEEIGDCSAIFERGGTELWYKSLHTIMWFTQKCMQLLCSRFVYDAAFSEWTPDALTSRGVEQDFVYIALLFLRFPHMMWTRYVSALLVRCCSHIITGFFTVLIATLFLMFDDCQ